jgi:hypothetical protein
MDSFDLLPSLLTAHLLMSSMGGGLSLALRDYPLVLIWLIVAVSGAVFLVTTAVSWLLVWAAAVCVVLWAASKYSTPD